MTSLLITDIGKSCCDRGFDLGTAIFLSKIGYDASGLKFLDEAGSREGGDLLQRRSSHLQRPGLRRLPARIEL
jgi:hypothetical protein